ncbi:hypothetical protein HCN44_003046 [Aphidius gifuensis]|uniref:Shootin-1 n=1 Tax=Aphidius gifuensis TaxID=684658 RepID=A0A835CJW1_APHGI|nr:shootin-1 [Aphidius gifuensis]KAF7987284.1 hypothetical protein HCN44_003046 [Aphidius gifuensis]
MSSNHLSHIPVPKSPRFLATPNKSTLYSLTKNINNINNNNNNNNRNNLNNQSGVSVAAHLASFESLDASVNNTNKSKIKKSIYTTNLRFNNNNNNSIDNNFKNQQRKFDTRRQLFDRKNDNNDNSTSEQNNKYARENQELHVQVREKDEKLEKLRTVSEAVCKEYEQLKRQYEIEMGAMHKAMHQASQWYQQNRHLKRQSQALVSRFLDSSPDALAELYPDQVDNDKDDVEELRQTITELSSEIAKLQTELNSVRLQEFEAQEQAALSNEKWEEEKELRQINDNIIKQSIEHNEKLENVTKLMNEQYQELKNQYEKEKLNTILYKNEIDNIKKERNILAHQSAILMNDTNNDDNLKYINAIQEIENLKRQLEDEKLMNQQKIEQLELKLKDNSKNDEFIIIEEKLKLAEFDLIQERAEIAEAEVERLREIIVNLEEKIDEIENSKVQISPVPAPPPPPPPPPPPLSQQFNDSSNASIKLLTRERLDNRNSAICDMENILGIKKKPCAVPQQPAIDDIINQIKGGRFTLKQTDKQRDDEQRKKRESQTTPPAVSEMLSILGTMRRRASSTRQLYKSSQDFQIQSNQGA